MTCIIELIPSVPPVFISREELKGQKYASNLHAFNNRNGHPFTSMNTNDLQSSSRCYHFETLDGPLFAAEAQHVEIDHSNFNGWYVFDDFLSNEQSAVVSHGLGLVPQDRDTVVVVVAVNTTSDIVNKRPL